MKVVENHSPVFGSATDGAKKFDVAFSKKAYTILSSGLYKFKIRAFIRELSCNAVDGHIALKLMTGSAPKYFDVTLPSQLDLQWKIRDYGIGLDQEQIFTLFTTYFASSKEESDDFIGAFGLGSKSPFCYTTTFTVVSWHGGVKSVYSIYMNDGVPSCTPVWSGPSDEPSGVEISIPIKECDIDEVFKESAMVYHTFDKDSFMPNFIGESIKLTNYTTDDRPNNLLKHNATYAIMGGVPYEIPSEYYENTICKVKYSGSNFIPFPMGSLNPLPNREELSLDQHTVGTIKEFFDKESVSIWNEIYKLVDGGKDAREKINRIKNNMSAYYSFVDSKIKHNGKTLKEWSCFYDGIEYSQAWSEYIRYMRASPRFNGVTRYNINTYTNSAKHTKIYKTRKDRYSGRTNYDLENGLTIKANDHFYEPGLCIVDIEDKNRNKKMKLLNKYGIIPNDNIVFGNSFSRRTNKMIRNLMVEFAKRYHHDDVRVYHIENLWSKHEQEITNKENEEKKRNRKERQYEPRERSPNLFVYSEDGYREEIVYSKDIDSLDGYYVKTVKGYAVNEDDSHFVDEEGYIRSPEDKDYYLMSVYLGKPVYVVNATLSKRAAKNDKLTMLSFNDFRNMYQDLLKKEMTPEKIGYSISNKVGHSYVFLPEKLKSILNPQTFKKWDDNVDTLYRYGKKFINNEHLEYYQNMIDGVEKSAIDSYNGLFEQIKKDHLLAYTLMCTRDRYGNRIDMSSDVVDEIVKQILGDKYVPTEEK